MRCYGRCYVAAFSGLTFAAERGGNQMRQAPALFTAVGSSAWFARVA